MSKIIELNTLNSRNWVEVFINLVNRNLNKLHMKKILIVLLILAISSSLIGQSNKIEGEWMLTTVKVEEKVYEPYYIINYRSDGVMVTMGIEVGSWKYNKAEHSIVTESPLEKEFSGVNLIQKLSKTEMVVKKGEAILYYIKIDSLKIASNNAKAKFLGVWKFENEMNEIRYVKFDLPDVLTVLSLFDGGSSKTSGTWMYSPRKKSIQVLARTHFMDGKSDLTMDGTAKMSLIGKEKNNKAERVDVSKILIENLNFTSQEVENSGEGEIPAKWQSAHSKALYLSKVNRLVYNDQVYHPSVGVFNTKALVFDVIVENETVSTNLRYVNGQDTMQFGEMVLDQYSNNRFYPVEEPYLFRVLATETITVPAGEFNCVVIEAIGDSNERLKYWMIIDQPGIYAKMIKISEEMEVEVYRTQELLKLELK